MFQIHMICNASAPQLGGIMHCRPLSVRLSVMCLTLTLLSTPTGNCTARWYSCGAASCIIGPVCGWVCGSVTTITRNCVHRSTQKWVIGKGTDRLQLIKFWPSRAPGKGVWGGAKIFGSALLQPARSVCVSSERFFIYILNRYDPRSARVPNSFALIVDLEVILRRNVQIDNRR